MSEQEQVNIMGQAATEYAEIRRQLAALVQKASGMSRTLRTLSDTLAPNSQNPHTAVYAFGGGWPSAVSGCPTADDLRAIESEIQAASKRKAELALSLKQMGLEPKD